MSLTETHPHLTAEWHPTRNGLVTPQKVTPGSNKKIWWVCGEGHEWETHLKTRIAGSPCPYCTNKKLLTGFNDLKTLHPELAKTIVNTTTDGSDILISSWNKLWWKCENNHEWETSIIKRVSGSYCPYCTNQKVLVGFNDLKTTNPELISEFNFTRNAPLLPENFTKGSRKKIWWVCGEGHEWETPVYSRAKEGYGCKQCSTTKKFASHPKLTNSPDLIKELSEKNTHTIEEILKMSVNSKTKIWWKCDKGHEWKTSIYSRNTGSKCPICSNKKIIPGVNDVLTSHPSVLPLAPENTNVLSHISYGSHKKIVWSCPDGHKWVASVKDITSNRSHCPVCSANARRSQAEKLIASHLETFDIKVLLNHRNIISGELDMYIPEKHVAIEFNGLYWHDENHKPKNYHYDKWLQCKNQGIQLIQIWEDDWNRNSNLILNMIDHKIGFSNKPKVYARDTEIIELKQSEIETFLNHNHIQGSTNGSIKLGLKTMEGNIVAVMLLKNEPHTKGKTLNLLRFTTSTIVVGGFSKLLNYVEKTYTPENIITFSDNTVSDGNLYETTGFKSDTFLLPDYMYVVKGERKHKFGYRLKRFRNDPTLQYEEGLTEKELAELNNLPRIWDAGKTRWVKKVHLL